MYRIGKGARPVAIIDHKGQRWPWPKGATLTDIFRIWYAGRKGVKGVKRPVKRPVKKVWRPREGVKKRPVWGGKTKRPYKGKRFFTARPRPRVAPPARRPTPRISGGK